MQRRLRVVRFKDQDLLWLCDLIIDHGAPGSKAGLGLPIGNLTSQHFANANLTGSPCALWGKGGPLFCVDLVKIGLG